MIAIIAAMKEELDAVLAHLDETKQININDLVFYTGSYHSKQLVLLESGIGKVNAAYATTTLINNFKVDYIINVGTAGGLKENQEVLDVVISSGVTYTDVDVTNFGYAFGQVPKMPAIYEANQKLMDITNTALETLNIRHHIGLVGTADSFIVRPEQKEFIQNNLSDILCVEMEAAAIAQVAYRAQIPFIVTRCLSDIAGKGSNDLEYKDYVVHASNNSSNICINVVNNI